MNSLDLYKLLSLLLMIGLTRETRALHLCLTMMRLMMSQKWILLENSLRHWLYLVGNSTKPSGNLIEDQGHMSVTSCLTTSKNLKIPEILASNARVNMMKGLTNRSEEHT